MLLSFPNRQKRQLGNLLVADRSQNPAARMENTHTLNCKRSKSFIACSILQRRQAYFKEPMRSQFVPAVC